MGYTTGARAALRTLSAALVVGMCIDAAQVGATPMPKARPYFGNTTLLPPMPLPQSKLPAQQFPTPIGKPLSLVPVPIENQRVFPPAGYAKMCVLRGWSVEVLESVDGPGGCGIDQPVSLRSVVAGGQEIGLTMPVQIECSLAQQLDGWLQDVAVPAARRELGVSITRIRTAAGYACRGRNNQRGAKLSEHGKGNAIDIAGFHLSDGREVTVEDGWDGSSAEVRFLSSLHKGACERFTTVLGPDADRYHRDHLHFDQGCHGKDCKYRVCK
ncbi:extensin family protein [Pseudovibrio sp. JE062]|uniref:extensin-like domain-containing protein n=1 Tax=Pseudovibrio sp. JE062 TaxID=439495 RepID=UPI000186B900|nr:extensin family protein [Pseudovibrio sp. JE062]EEA95807.1 extensin family protein [Pseudovibrio sp. JE062]